MSHTALWPGGPLFETGPEFPLGMDAVLLADFAAAHRPRLACDLGCGDGAVSVLLCARFPGLRLDGVELRPDAAARCRRNLAENGWADRTRVVAGDLRAAAGTDLPAGAYDLVVANPPYFPLEGGKSSPSASRAAARSELACTPEALCAAAARLTKNGGDFCLVHRPERLPALFAALTGCGLEPKRLRFVHHTAAAPPSLCLVEARRGGRPALAVLPPLLLRGPDGAETEEYRRIYHREVR